MFFKSYLLVLLTAFVANAAVIAVRKQDAATTNNQLTKLKAYGFLDNFNTNTPNFVASLTKMKATDGLAKVVSSKSFISLKAAADQKAGRNTNAKQTNSQKATSTGILDKLSEWGKGQSVDQKLAKMNAQFLLIKIAQSQAFKDAYNAMANNRKQQEAKVNSDIAKGKKPTVVKIVHKNKGKPTATVVSIKGGPAITLAASGTKTTFAGKVYTVSPTAIGSITTANKDNGAAGISGSFLAKFIAVFGGALGGIMLVL